MVCDQLHLQGCQDSEQRDWSVSHGAASPICITSYLRDTNASTDVRLVSKVLAFHHVAAFVPAVLSLLKQVLSSEVGLM